MISGDVPGQYVQRPAERGDGRFWDPLVETMPPRDVAALQLERLRSQLTRVGKNSAYYSQKWAEAGFDPASVTSLDGFDAPLTTKDELRSSQAEHPPLGNHAAVSMSEVVRVHSSSGTTGRPSYIGITRQDHADWTEVVSRVLYSEGMRPGDVVVHAFGLSFFVGGLPLKDATENVGATFVPIGTSATDRLVTSTRDLGGTTLMSTPSYATYLAEYCRERLGVEPAELGFRKLLLGAEPGASIPAVRARLERDYNAVVSDGMGNADVFPIYAASCPAQAGLHLCAQDLMLTELIDPETGARLPWEDGVEGELVATHLRRDCVPVVRLRLFDRVVAYTAACVCGRTSPRLWCEGRTDDMLIVSGVNVWPSAVEDVVVGMAPRTTGALRMIVPGTGPRVDPPVRIQVEYGHEEHDLTVLKRDVENVLREKLIFPAEVELVPPAALPRYEMKAQLVHQAPH